MYLCSTTNVVLMIKTATLLTHVLLTVSSASVNHALFWCTAVHMPSHCLERVLVNIHMVKFFIGLLFDIVWKIIYCVYLVNCNIKLQYKVLNKCHLFGNHFFLSLFPVTTATILSTFLTQKIVVSHLINVMHQSASKK